MVEGRTWLTLLMIPLLIVPFLVVGAGISEGTGEFLPLSDGPQWPVQFGDPAHSCRSDYEERSSNGTLIWSKNVGSSPSPIRHPTQPIVDGNGTMYISSRNGVLYSVSNEGDILWSRQMNLDEHIASQAETPALGDNGILYVPVYARIAYEPVEYVFEVEAIDTYGTYIWDCTLPELTDISSITLGPGGEIYVLGNQRIAISFFENKDITTLYCISQDGIILWDVEYDGDFDILPAIGPDGVIYLGSESSLDALYPNGTLKWSFSVPYGVSSPPSLNGDTVYFGSYDNHLYSIGTNGSLNWKFETGRWVESCPAIREDGRVVVGSNDGFVYCLEVNGSELWNVETGSPVDGVTIDGAGTALVSSRWSQFMAIDSDGQLLWEYSFDSRYSTAVINIEGFVFIYDSEAVLHAFGHRAPSKPRSVMAIDFMGGVYLTWTLPSGEGEPPIDEIDIYRADDITEDMSSDEIMARMEILATIPSNQSVFVDRSVENISYGYSLVARNEEGASGFTNPVIATGGGYGQFTFPAPGGVPSYIYIGTGIFLISILGIMFVNSAYRARKDHLDLGVALRRPFHMAWGMLVHPFRTFEEIKARTMGQAMLYFMAWTVVFLGASVALIEIVGTSGGIYPVLEDLSATSVLGTVIALAFLLVMALVLLLIIVGLINFICVILGGKGGYDETAKAVIYGSTPGYLLGWIPFLLLIPGAWSLINQGIGFKELHRLTAIRVVGVVVLSIVAVLLFYIFVSWFLLSL
jgi:outer membrane protein assembly factor BamB